MRILKQVKIRDFHQARWNEPIIMELSVEGERGVLLPEMEDEIAKDTGQ